MIGRSLLSWLAFGLLVGSPAPAGAVNLDINSKGATTVSGSQELVRSFVAGAS